MFTLARRAIGVVGALALTLSCGGSHDSLPSTTAAATPETAQSPTLMASTADLADKRIGVMMGSVYDGFATRNYPQATILQFDSQADLRLAVLAGKVDAGLSDEQPLYEVLRTNGDLAILGDPLLKLPLGVGFRKGNTELRQAFNRFLAEIRHNGVHADMVERWLTQHGTRMPEIPAQAPRGVITVGISAGGLPYAAVQDGTYAG
ncbi:MAG: substrate-binding periplasmic protein, partial [Vicinamibacterales bacterium]